MNRSLNSEMVFTSEGTTQPTDKLKQNTPMKNNQLTLEELQFIAGGKGKKDFSSQSDCDSEGYTVLKKLGIFYGKWIGGMAGGMSWDRAAYEAGKAANIPGMDDNKPEK